MSDGMHAPPTPDERPRQRRRIKLIKPGLQLRLIGSFLGLCALTILAQTLVLAVLMTIVAKELPAGGAYLAQELPTLLGKTLALSFLVLLPSALLIGVRITFRIAGPLYHFERHLGEVARGEEPAPCRLRKTDELQELCELINAALAEARAQGETAGRPAEREERRAAG